MDRFFCALMLCALLTFGALSCNGEAAQPVFFSLLFPQLMPGYEETMTATPQEALPGEVVFL